MNPMGPTPLDGARWRKPMRDAITPKKIMRDHAEPNPRCDKTMDPMPARCGKAAEPSQSCENTQRTQRARLPQKAAKWRNPRKYTLRGGAQSKIRQNQNKDKLTPNQTCGAKQSPIRHAKNMETILQNGHLILMSDIWYFRWCYFVELLHPKFQMVLLCRTVASKILDGAILYYIIL